MGISIIYLQLNDFLVYSQAVKCVENLCL
jgi:hypothetical protein